MSYAAAASEKITPAKPAVMTTQLVSKKVEENEILMTEEKLKELERIEEEELLNPKRNKAISFCLENREKILDLHSSLVWTKVFELECECCGRFFKHCMFSKAERKSYHGPSCRWCQLDTGCSIEADQFCIQSHIHCNRSGKKVCGLGYMSLTRPKDKAEAVVQGNGLADIAAPEVPVFFVPQGKKRSQKERKKLEREMRERQG